MKTEGKKCFIKYWHFLLKSEVSNQLIFDIYDDDKYVTFWPQVNDFILEVEEQLLPSGAMGILVNTNSRPWTWIFHWTTGNKWMMNMTFDLFNLTKINKAHDEQWFLLMFSCCLVMILNIYNTHNRKKTNKQKLNIVWWMHAPQTDWTKCQVHKLNYNNRSTWTQHTGTFEFTSNKGHVPDSIWRQHHH